MAFVIDKIKALWYYKFIRVCIYLFLAMIVSGFLLDLIIMPIYPKHGETIPLPDVTKIRYEDAKLALRAEGFNIVKSEERYDSRFPMGYVIKQVPAPGTLVKSGRRVSVILSKGERRFEMPKIVGTSDRDSKLLLSKFGLRPGQKSYEYSSYYPKGVVTHQSITPGVEVPMNTFIDLTISLGSVPSVFIVPSVEGRTLDDARDIIKQAGLQIGSIRYQPMNALLPETVIKQSLQSGTDVPKDTRINLIVSSL